VIVLDTNVLSELMRSAPDPSVVGWIGKQAGSQLYTTSITMAEMLRGIAIMPAGRRRADLAKAADAMFNEDFADRILVFDAAAAVRYAEVAAIRRRAGRPIATLDAQIAATALVAGAAVATRNVKDFEGCGLTLVNPWTAP
jgi:predicted nucleic acid-binding protein